MVMVVVVLTADHQRVNLAWIEHPALVRFLSGYTISTGPAHTSTPL